MQNPWFFIERASADAVGAVQDVVRPKAGAFAGIDVPDANSFSVTDVVSYLCRISVREGLGGAILRAFFTGLAKFPDSEFDRAVRVER